MFLKIISLGFLLYILYKFVFEFLVPVIMATRKIKKGFRDMQQNAQDNMHHQASRANATTAAPTEKNKEAVGDYIDFEEIK